MAVLRKPVARRDILAACGAVGAIGGISAFLAGCSNGPSTAGSSSGTGATAGAVSIPATATAASLIEISQGRLLGFQYDGVYAFRGIPYATAERFQDPTPVTSFDNGYRNALLYGEVSPQDRTLSATAVVNPNEFFSPSNGTADMVGNERCQYLNVWTGSLDGSKPVIVFFHGGGLSNGASTELSYYDGFYLAKSQDVVFVSVNTRLNVLGFLDMSAYGEQFANSGIAGMMDGVVALQWVHDNIASFGGDPANVTILGQSGGGTKVTTLACMAETADLFDKVVMMSGGYSTSTKEDGLANTQKLVDYLGLSAENAAETLVNMPYEELYQAATEAGCSWSTYTGTGTFETPLIDPATGEVNQYAAARTWMIGNAYAEFNCNMGAFSPYMVNGPEDLPNADYTNIDEDSVRAAIDAQYGDDADAFIEAFEKAYPDHKLVDSLWIASGKAGLSHWAVTNPETGTITLMNKAGIPVYNYVTAYVIPCFGGITMSHTLDIPFMFNSIDEAPYLIAGDADNAHGVAQAMSSALAAFAATGDPSTDNLKWEPYESDNHACMVFDTTSEVRVGYDEELMTIMDAHPTASPF